MLFIGYKNCSTSNKAQAWLDEHGVSYHFRDIKTENPTRAELTEWLQRSGLPLKRFFNTSGMLYKQMDLKHKLAEMSEAEQLDLLSTDGMLVKRPLVITEDLVLPGFKESEWQQLLAEAK